MSNLNSVSGNSDEKNFSVFGSCAHSLDTNHRSNSRQQNIIINNLVHRVHIYVSGQNWIQSICQSFGRCSCTTTRARCSCHLVWFSNRNLYATKDKSILQSFCVCVTSFAFPVVIYMSRKTNLCCNRSIFFSWTLKGGNHIGEQYRNIGDLNCGTIQLVSEPELVMSVHCLYKMSRN